MQKSVLNPSLKAQPEYGKDHGCLEETRKELLEKISDFLCYTDKLPAEERDTFMRSMPKLFWLCGMAGSGKSSVANTVAADIYEGVEFDLTCFFCKRDNENLNDPKRLFLTIAYHISRYYPSYGADLVHLLRKPKEEAALSGWDIEMQYNKLLGGLLPKVMNPLRRHVVVIDALDECGRPEEQKMLAECLLRLANAVPWIKVFVTSRPEPEIRDVFSSPDNNCELANINEENDTDADIRRFIEAKLEELKPRVSLADAEIDKLVEQAASLFIWCSTLFKHIGSSRSPSKALKRFLSGSAPADSLKQLYALYDQVILSAANSESSEDVRALHAFLGIVYITAGNRPVSTKALCNLLRSDEEFEDEDMDSIQSTKGSLHAVLFEDTTMDGAIRVHHPSVLDYIQARFDNGKLSRSLQEMHQLMFRGCSTVMDTTLRFNICKLEDASVLNDDVPDIEARITASIPEELQYSSLFGFRHLFASGLETNDEGVRSTVSTFLNKKSLFWLEAMSLLKAVGQYAAILHECALFFAVSRTDYFSILTNDKICRICRTYHQLHPSWSDSCCCTRMRWQACRTSTCLPYHGSPRSASCKRSLPSCGSNISLL